MEYIYEKEGVLDHFMCASIIERFEIDHSKRPGATIAGIDKTIKDSTDLPISIPENRHRWEDIIKITSDLVIEALKDYVPYIKSKLKLPPDCGLSEIQATINGCTIGLPQIQKTSKDGFYTWHHDGNLNRIFTYIIYLNDVPSENGGTTDFIAGKSVTPKTGKIVIFPAHPIYIHRGNKLTNGSKYLITNFVYDGKPIYTNERA
jgi:hypothetical protein